ncbi:unnamed protein product [Arctogadus glacialis]
MMEWPMWTVSAMCLAAEQGVTPALEGALWWNHRIPSPAQVLLAGKDFSPGLHPKRPLPFHNSQNAPLHCRNLWIQE